MRVLIVGGGVAGLTLAARLRQRGLHPTVIDRLTSYGAAGYAITLWPLGSRVLHDLGLWHRFVRASQPLRRYVIHDRNGTLLRAFDLESSLAPQGSPRTLARGDLLELLESANGGTPVELGTEVTHLENMGSTALVHFSDGREREFDLVVGADGIASQTRNQVDIGADPRPLGWRIWWWWATAGVTPRDELHESWSTHRILSIYPTPDRIACVAALPNPATGPVDDVLERLTAAPANHPVDRWIVQMLRDAERVDCLDLVEVTVQEKFRGRVVLIGDAATGLLPTTGVGASLAMESAAVLDDELSRVNTATIDTALRRFGLRRHARITVAQRRARVFGELMMLGSPSARFLRDLGVRYVPAYLIRRELSRWNSVPL